MPQVGRFLSHRRMTTHPFTYTGIVVGARGCDHGRGVDCLDVNEHIARETYATSASPKKNNDGQRSLQGFYCY